MIIIYFATNFPMNISGAAIRKIYVLCSIGICKKVIFKQAEEIVLSLMF